MTSTHYSKLALAINAILFASIAHADNTNVDTPSATLSTITITAEVDGYTTDNSNSSTGLDLDFKDNAKVVTVITKEVIKDQQLKSITDVVNATSGVNTYHLDAGRTKFYARGFEVDNFKVDGMSPNYASAYGEGAGPSSTAIYDTIEIVKGANGLMSGSGNPSATINLARKKADTSELSGEVAATYDRFGTYSIMADVGSKLNQSGSVRGRAVVEYTAGDTFIDYESPANKTAHTVVDVDITDNTTVSVGATHQEKIQDGSMWGGLPIFYTDGSKINWDTNQSNATEWQTKSGVTDEVFATLRHDFNANWQLDTSANFAGTDGELKAIYFNGYVYKPNGMVIGGIDPATGAPKPADPLVIDYQTDTTQLNVATKLTGLFDAFEKEHKVMLGADYNKNEENVSYRYGLGNPPIFGIVNNWTGKYPEPQKWGDSTKSNTIITESAIYGSLQLNIADPLSVVMGSRFSNYNQEKKENGVSKHNQKSDSVLTPFVGLTYKINDNASVFASYTDVFKPQVERNVKGEYLDPIKGENIEVGFKGTNDSETLQAQFSVFQIEQDNLAQIDGAKNVAGSPTEKAYYEAEGATSKGVEVELTGKLSDNWEGSLGYTHFNIEDAKGNKVDTINPNTTINLFTKYNMDNYISGLTLGGGVQWHSERYYTFSNILNGGATEKLGEKSVTSMNLMANYKINDNLDLQMNVNNALNEDEPVYDGFKQVENREPLNVTGKISYKW